METHFSSQRYFYNEEQMGSSRVSQVALRLQLSTFL